jgi:hypothetical protein
MASRPVDLPRRNACERNSLQFRCAGGAVHPTRRRTARLELGKLEAPVEEVFGRITDVAVDRSRGFFVLDGQARELRWFGPNGQFLDRVGRAGQGPGEFLSPTAVALGNADEVAVLDVQNARISWYRASDGTLTHLDDSRVILGAFDFCLVGSTALVMASSPEGPGIFFVMGRDGSVERTFGAVPSVDPVTVAGVPASALAMVELSSVQGRIACDLDSDRFVVVHERLPIVRAFSLSGDVVWETRLRDYRQVHWVADERLRMRLGPDPATGTAHTTREVATTDDGRVIVSLHEGSLADPEGRLELRVLRMDTGEEVGGQFSRFTVRHHGFGQIVAVDPSPWPRLLVYEGH